jgi:hypothetical protein
MAELCRLTFCNEIFFDIFKESFAAWSYITVLKLPWHRKLIYISAYILLFLFPQLDGFKGFSVPWIFPVTSTSASCMFLRVLATVSTLIVTSRRAVNSFLSPVPPVISIQDISFVSFLSAVISSLVLHKYTFFPGFLWQPLFNIFISCLLIISVQCKS